MATRNKTPRSYTPDNLTTVETLQRLKMAWIVFWVVLFFFCVFTGLTIYFLFTEGIGWHKRFIVGGIDGIIGLVLRIIVRYLFPQPK